jgi:ribosome biogenesis GTPase / thiamine phosphate phosphatase
LSELHGTVRRASGGVYDVELASGEVVEAVLRGRIKREERTGDRVAAGDHVRLDRQPDGKHTIEVVAPRQSELARRDPRTGGRRAKVIVANVDQVVAVFAATNPEPKLRLVDRFLVLAESNSLPAVLVINKVDLADLEQLRARFEPYASAGYALHFTSVKQEVGIDELRERLCGRTSVFTGPSGVGKSSLLNSIEPGLKLRIGDVSEAIGKGQHTTVNAELIPLQCGGYVADTPGLRELGLWGVPADELDQYFPEMRPYLGHCRFGASCTHLHEPGCEILGAVAAGIIPQARYESFSLMRKGEQTRDW